MIELNVKELIDSVPILNELGTKSLRGRTAFQIARLLRECSPEVELFEKQRRELIMKFCDKDENNNVKTNENGDTYISPDKVQQFNNEFLELLNEKITINSDKIRLDDIEDVNFSPNQMISFSAFIEE